MRRNQATRRDHTPFKTILSYLRSPAWSSMCWRSVPLEGAVIMCIVVYAFHFHQLRCPRSDHEQVISTQQYYLNSTSAATVQ